MDDGEQGDVTETAQPSEADADAGRRAQPRVGRRGVLGRRVGRGRPGGRRVARPEGEGEGEGDGERQTRGSTAAPVIGAAGGAVAAGAATTEPEAGPPLPRRQGAAAADPRHDRRPAGGRRCRPGARRAGPAGRRAARPPRGRAAALAPMADERATKIVPAKPQKKTTDKFWASLGLFLLRVVGGHHGRPRHPKVAEHSGDHRFLRQHDPAVPATSPSASGRWRSRSRSPCCSAC